MDNSEAERKQIEQALRAALREVQELKDALQASELRSKKAEDAMFEIEQHPSESEVRYVFLAQLDEALRGLKDPAGIQSIATQLLAQHLNVDRCNYAEVLPNGRVYIHAEFHRSSLPPMPASLRIADFGQAMANALQEGRDAAVADSFAWPNTTPEERGALMALSSRALIGAVIHKPGEHTVLLSAHHATVRAWTTQEAALLRDVAERIWDAFERAHFEKALRSCEAQLATERRDSERALRDSTGRLKSTADELQQRTRNLLGVVRALADKTMRSSSTLTEFKFRFHPRLAAVARVQGLLSRWDEGVRITLEELLHSELSAHAALDDAGRITLRGPAEVALQPKTVQNLALAIHELATNAVKYGALGQTGGRLAVRWHLDLANGRTPWLHIDWRESNVTMPPPAASPERGVSGLQLIEQTLADQLNARTSFVLGADGVHCTIALPYEAKVHEGATGQ